MPSKLDKSAKSGSLKIPPAGTTSLPASLIDRFRTVLPGGSSQSQAPKKRLSRKEREDRRAKILYYTIGAAAGLVVLLFGWGLLNDYYLKPNKVLASVNSEEITREEYWKVRSHNLLVQSSQYQQIASFSSGEQQTQYLTLAQQAQAQFDATWGSTDTDEATLNQMITDQVYLQGLEAGGAPVTQDDIDAYIDQQFQPAESPLVTPSPTPTLIPERAAWATQTAQALGTPAPVESSPVASPDAVPGFSSPVPSTPLPGSSPMAVESTPQLSRSDAEATTEANYVAYGDQVFDDAHMSRSDYETLIIAPAVARQQVQALAVESVGQSADQVEASHILAGTQELADSIYAELQAGADFAELARQQSIDTATASTGGQLGWFAAGVMVPEFDAVVFGMAPGEYSEPFQTEFGWHIVLVQDVQADRAMTDEQISQAQQIAVQKWDEEHRAQLGISSDLPPTPTPFPQQFAPPAGAPASEQPAETVATPQAVEPAVSPAASPKSNPEAATPAP